MPPKFLEKLKERFPEEILEVVIHPKRPDDPAIIIKKNRCHEILHFLKEDPECAFEALMDLGGVDYLNRETPRFEAVYQLYSLLKNHRLRVRVKVPEDDLCLPTVIDVWGAADWFEREAAEMFGFRFEGHPNPRHLLLSESFEGYPLRKDYPIAKRQKIPNPVEEL